MKRKNKTGISMIVLVITIIIMIILAASVVITLNNTGIIRQSNVAVDKSELKEVEHVVALAWAEAYMEGNRTPEDLKASMDEKLTGVDLTNYEYAATEKGVSVTQVIKRAEEKRPRPKLNEYGFYYDVTYVSPFMILGVGPIKIVFHEDGSVEQYAGLSGANLGLCTCNNSYEAGSATYEKGKILLDTNHDSTPDEIKVLGDDGMELEQAKLPFVCTFEYPEPMPKNKVYSGLDMNQMPMVIMLEDDTHLTITYYPDTTATESVTETREIYLEGDGHIIKYPGVEYRDVWQVGGSTGGFNANVKMEEAEIYVTDDANQLVLRYTESKANAAAILNIVTAPPVN